MAGADARATRLTRGRLLWAGAGAAAGAVAIGAGRDDGSPLAARSKAADVEILRFFLTLEQVQEAFYRDALESGRLEGELLELATAVRGQEREHVAFLTDRLGGKAKPSPRSDFGDAFESPERFRSTAIELEETAIAGYIGQAAHLGGGSIGAAATLLSVEARQVAWLRDLAGVSPAPRAADPARSADDVLSSLREKGFIS
jgi:rubrerythrin